MTKNPPLAPTKEPAALWHALETLPDTNKACLAVTLWALLEAKNDSNRCNQIMNMLIGQLGNVLADPGEK